MITCSESRDEMLWYMLERLMRAITPTLCLSVLIRFSSAQNFSEALSELVVSKKIFDEHNIILTNGQTTDLTLLQQQLREIGFKEVDYVYEPGQFATRGSILDVYSYSCELPFRIDFFGDEIDSIRTFEVEDQLSKEHRQRVEIVPALARMEEEKIPFMDFLPETTFVACRDMAFVCERIDNIFREGFSTQALNERQRASGRCHRA